MRLPAQYEIVEELEQYLGDPADSATIFSFARSMELDEREQYPEEACRLLNEWGLPDYYVPVAAGGRLASFEQLLGLWRIIARRDVTVAVAHGKTFLGSVLVWAGGTAAQQGRLAALIKRGGQVALAYNEQAHGSDFMATEVAAQRTSAGFVLNGEKWLINNATRGAALTLFARTNETGGARGFSLFLVEKATLDATTYEHLPRLKTLGVRGAEFSGIKFKKCLTPVTSLINSEGSGLEQTLKGFQITRTLILGLSLGAANTALRTTLDFALTRRLYGTSVFEIPQAQRQLVEAFVDVLACECLAVAVSRALQQTPEQMRLYSAAVKFLVPTTVEAIIEKLSVVIGARHYLRENHCEGIFQKFMRDNSVLSIFHAGTALTLTTVALHLRDLAKQRAKNSASNAGELGARLSAIFDLDAPVAAFDPEKLKIYTRGRDDVMQGLDSACETLGGLGVDASIDEEVLGEIVRLTADLLKCIKAEDMGLHELELREGICGDSPEMFEHAKRYCILLAGAACVHMWLHNRARLGAYFARGEWLALALQRVQQRLRGRAGAGLCAPYAAHAAQELERLFRAHMLFSILPIQLAEGDRHTQPYTSQDLDLQCVAAN